MKRLQHKGHKGHKGNTGLELVSFASSVLSPRSGSIRRGVF